MTASRIEQLAEPFLDGHAVLWPGDCRQVLPGLAENSFDSCVTDPPYGLSFMGKGWDHGVPAVAHWRAIFRTLKPGAHLTAFGGSRTFGRLWVVIEEAGFEIRDTIMWVYGSGFPKSHDVSKGIDKAAGAEREIVGEQPDRWTGKGDVLNFATDRPQSKIPITAGPATDAARQWLGYGTALKPAVEPIVLARKPLSESTVAANCLKWGTGALNIDGCRVATSDQVKCTGDGFRAGKYGGQIGHGDATLTGKPWKLPQQGRWPANLIHDGSEEVIAAFPETTALGAYPAQGARFGYNGGERKQRGERFTLGDAGSAARFFYSAKADADDRLGSKHPTVKPLDLMQYLVRLVTPKGGTVLDPFAGTGTTAEAAFREGMNAVLIEREEEYCADIRRRMALVMSGAHERKRESIKARNKIVDDGPLFGALP